MQCKHCSYRVLSTCAGILAFALIHLLSSWYVLYNWCSYTQETPELPTFFQMTYYVTYVTTGIRWQSGILNNRKVDIVQILSCYA